MVKNLLLESVDQQTVRVCQITDAHLGKTSEETLLGINTESSLQAVLAMVAQKSQALDLLLCTGDLSNDGSPEAYQRFHQRVGSLKKPQVWLPGNHDSHERMAASFAADTDVLSRRVDIGAWTILMLDSSVPKQVGGELGEAELNFLKQQLPQLSERHVMVCVHHHTLPMNCAWLDTQVIADGDQLLDILSQAPQVKVLLCGHVHQDSTKQHAHFDLISTPSTCIQFAPNSDEFKLDLLNPGCRWFELYPDGSYQTQVERVTGVEFEVDTQASGY